MLLRYFHALTAVAAKNNMTIVMPISFTNEWSQVLSRFETIYSYSLHSTVYALR
jgi:hypothetical protein